MKTRKSKWMRVSVLALSVSCLLAAGCATRPAPMRSHQIDALNKQLGTIGVTGAQYVPDVEMQIPAKGAGQGAAGGATTGALAPLKVLQRSGSGGDVICPPCAIVAAVAMVAAVPFGAVIGGVGGAITADSAEEVNAREAKLNQALTELKMQEELRSRVQAKIEALSAYSVKLVDDQGPSKAGQVADYRPLKAAGIDSVHEIIITRLELSGSGRVNPSLAISLHATSRLVSTADNRKKFGRNYYCAGRQEKFEYWAAENAQQFSAEIQRCYDDLSGRMVRDLYVDNTLQK